MRIDTSWSNYMALKKSVAKLKPKKKKSAPAKSQLTLLNLKVGSKDRAALQAMAKKYADGNLSAWLRRAGLKYRPA